MALFVTHEGLDDYEKHLAYKRGYEVGYKDARKELAEQGLARNKGKWVLDKRFPNHYWFCTCCEWYNDYSKSDFKYCPNCGAEMEVVA